MSSSDQRCSGRDRGDCELEATTLRDALFGASTVLALLSRERQTLMLLRTLPCRSLTMLPRRLWSPKLPPQLPSRLGFPSPQPLIASPPVSISGSSPSEYGAPGANGRVTVGVATSLIDFRRAGMRDFGVDLRLEDGVVGTRGLEDVERERDFGVGRN